MAATMRFAAPAALAGSSLTVVSPLRAGTSGASFGNNAPSFRKHAALVVRAERSPPSTFRDLGKIADSTKVEITPEGVQQHMRETESEKRSVVGTIPKSGATIPRPEIERRPETGDASIVSQMQFDGAAPETINGRLAMVGFVWAIVAEYFTHKTVLEQAAPGSQGLLYFLAVSQVLIYASLVPILRGESPDSRKNGPFNAKAERWNGRLAMIGFAGLIISEVVRGSPLLH